jgi:hypothetical protein
MKEYTWSESTSLNDFVEDIFFVGFIEDYVFLDCGILNPSLK